MTEITQKIGEQGAAVIDTTEEAWEVPPVAPALLEKQANDALAYPEIYGEIA